MKQPEQITKVTPLAQAPEMAQPEQVIKDEFFMRAALQQANLAAAAGEVPIGAVVVYQEEISSMWSVK